VNPISSLVKLLIKHLPMIIPLLGKYRKQGEAVQDTFVKVVEIESLLFNARSKDSPGREAITLSETLQG
jgi:hypothetical protein